MYMYIQSRAIARVYLRPICMAVGSRQAYHERDLCTIRTVIVEFQNWTRPNYTLYVVGTRHKVCGGVGMLDW